MGGPTSAPGLGLFAELVHAAGGGPVADVGCGPGYVTGHLHAAGVGAFGIDLSPEMVAIARRARGWLRDAGFTLEAELVIGPDEDVPGAVIFARRDA